MVFANRSDSRRASLRIGGNIKHVESGKYSYEWFGGCIFLITAPYKLSIFFHQYTMNQKIGDKVVGPNSSHDAASVIESLKTSMFIDSVSLYRGLLEEIPLCLILKI